MITAEEGSIAFEFIKGAAPPKTKTEKKAETPKAETISKSETPKGETKTEPPKQAPIKSEEKKPVEKKTC